jgi:hypothetical protein
MVFAMNAFGPGINRPNYEMSGNADPKDVVRCYEACKVRAEP